MTEYENLCSVVILLQVFVRHFIPRSYSRQIQSSEKYLYSSALRIRDEMLHFCQSIPSCDLITRNSHHVSPPLALTAVHSEFAACPAPSYKPYNCFL